MDGMDAAEEIYEAIVDFCENVDSVSGVDRVQMKGDGNFGGCQIRFDDRHELDSLQVWGGHQFFTDRVENIDVDPDELDPVAPRTEPRDRDATKYGPVELEVNINGQSRQVSTFGWPTENRDEWEVNGRPGQPSVPESPESSLEWAESPEPGVLHVKERHVDEGPVTEIDIRSD
jgi:hypothetical protein